MRAVSGFLGDLEHRLKAQPGETGLLSRGGQFGSVEAVVHVYLGPVERAVFPVQIRDAQSSRPG